MAPEADPLPRNSANHVPLSPVSFLVRAAHVWGGRVAVIHGDRRLTYAELLERSRRLASALHRAGVAPGETVAALLPNIPEMLEAHSTRPRSASSCATPRRRSCCWTASSPPPPPPPWTG